MIKMIYAVKCQVGSKELDEDGAAKGGKKTKKTKKTKQAHEHQLRREEFGILKTT